VRQQIDNAVSAWEKHSNIEGAIAGLRSVLKTDPTVFEANYRLAELLVVHHPNDHKNRKIRLEEAYHCLCEAKPDGHSSYVWKLLSWIMYQQFVEGDRKDSTLLDRAIKYCDQGRIMAKSQMDEFGNAIAKVYLIIYLNEHYELNKPTNKSSHDLAQRYVSEVDAVIDDGLGKWLECNYLVGKAMTMAATEGPTNEVCLLLSQAHAKNIRSRLVAAVTDRFLNG
jgi:hypothetical protein